MTVLQNKYSDKKITVFGPQLQYFPTKYIKYLENGKKVIKD